MGVLGGGKEGREFTGLKGEDQRSIFNCSFECEVSPMLKKAPGKWLGKMQAIVESQLQLFELFADVCEEAANI